MDKKKNRRMFNELGPELRELLITVADGSRTVKVSTF